MTPTNKLRFVERSEPMHPFYKTVAHDGALIQAKHHYRVLQQWWSIGISEIAKDPSRAGEGQWIDVPLETEE